MKEQKPYNMSFKSQDKTSSCSGAAKDAAPFNSMLYVMRKMAKNIFLIIIIFAGAVSTAWGIDKIIGGDFVLDSKYTLEGRDGMGIILSIFLGLLTIAWGLFELYFKGKK